MVKQFSIAVFFLWVFVIVLGIEIGAGLYETFVVMPLWDTLPPDSVTAYYRHNAANPQFTLNAGPRFWMFFTPAVGLLGIGALVTGLRTNPEHRKWRIVGTVLAIIVVISTLTWFVPNIIKLSGENVLTMSSDDVTSLTNWWVRLNWLRIIVYLTAWISALRAFSLSPNIESNI